MKNGLVFECTPPAYMHQTDCGYVTIRPPFAELLVAPSVYTVSEGVHLVAADYALLDIACMHTFGHNIGTHVIDLAGTMCDDLQCNPTTAIGDKKQIVYTYHTPSITLLSAVFLHKDIHHSRDRSVERMLPHEVEQAEHPDSDEVYDGTMHKHPLHPIYSDRMSDTFDINLPTDMTAMYDMAESAMAALDVFQIACVTTTLFRSPEMAPIKLTVHTVAAHFDWAGGSNDSMTTAQLYTRLGAYLDQGADMPKRDLTRITPLADAFAAMFLFFRQLSMNYALAAPGYDAEKHGTQVFQSILANATQWMVHQTNAILSAGTDHGRAVEDPSILPHIVMDIVMMFNRKARAIFPAGEQSNVLLSNYTRDSVETQIAYNVPELSMSMRAAYQALNTQLNCFDPPSTPCVQLLSTPLQSTGYPLSQTLPLSREMNFDHVYADMTFTVVPPTNRDHDERLNRSRYNLGMQILQRRHLLKYLCDKGFATDTVEPHVREDTFPKLEDHGEIPSFGQFIPANSQEDWFGPEVLGPNVRMTHRMYATWARERWASMGLPARRLYWQRAIMLYKIHTDPNESDHPEMLAGVTLVEQWLGMENEPPEAWTYKLPWLFPVLDDTSDFHPHRYQLLRSIHPQQYTADTPVTSDWFIRLNPASEPILTQPSPTFQIGDSWPQWVRAPMLRHIERVTGRDHTYTEEDRPMKLNHYKRLVTTLLATRELLNTIHAWHT